MMDDHQNPVLIDFGSCELLGKRIWSQGTRAGWVTVMEFPTEDTICQPWSIFNVRNWLGGEKKGQAYGIMHACM